MSERGQELPEGRVIVDPEDYREVPGRAEGEPRSLAWPRVFDWPARPLPTCPSTMGHPAHLQGVKTSIQRCGPCTNSRDRP